MAKKNQLEFNVYLGSRISHLLSEIDGRPQSEQISLDKTMWLLEKSQFELQKSRRIQDFQNEFHD